MVTVRPYHHALPVVGGRAAKLNQPASAAASDYRPIHVSSYDRKGRDFCATPNWVTEALLQRFQFRGPIWEPCCGAGAMSTVLAEHGYEVVSTDIADCGFGASGVDFLASRVVRDGPSRQSGEHQPISVAGLPGRAPEARRTGQLGNIQTAVLGSFTPASTPIDERTE